MTNMDQEREGATTPKTRTPQGGPNVQQEHAHHYDNKQKMQIHQAPQQHLHSQPEFKMNSEKEQESQNTTITASTEPSPVKNEKIKLHEVNSYLTCLLCKGYLIDATTISECLHSFCRSCIIKFLQDNSHCPECELVINKTKPNLKLDKTLQDIVYKLVPELYLNEMTRRRQFYSNHPMKTAHLSPEQRGEDTERIIFNARDKFSLSLEYISDDSTPGAILLPPNKNEGITNPSIINNNNNSKDMIKETESMMRRYLQCPGMCRIDVLKKFVRNKYNVDTTSFHIDILYKRVPLPDHYTLIDIAYIYSWKRNEPMKFFFRITDIKYVRHRFDFYEEGQVQAPSLPKRSAVPKPLTSSPPLLKDFKVEHPKKVLPKKVKTVRFQNETELLKPPRAQNIAPIKSDTKSKCATLNGIVNKVIKNQSCATHSVKRLNHSDNNIDVKNKAGSNIPPTVGDVKYLAKKPRPNNVKQKDTVGSVNGTSRTSALKSPLNTSPYKHQEKVATEKPPQESERNNVSLVQLNATANANQNKQGISATSSDSASKSVTHHSNDKQVTLDFFKVNDSSADQEKEQFLKSIELQARKTVHQIANEQNQRNQPIKLTLSTKTKSPKLEKSKTQGLKRKISNPQRNGDKNDKPKKPKLIKKKATAKSSLPRQKSKSILPEPNLKSLLNTCKIPSSLSITCVNGDRETQIKPVINHIEILKLPELVIEGDCKNSPSNGMVPDKLVDAEESKPMDKEKLEKVGTTMKLQTVQDEIKKEEKQIDTKSEISITTITVKKTKEEPKPGVHPNLPKVLLSNPSTMRPITSFQKMFEDTIKKNELKEKEANKEKEKDISASNVEVSSKHDDKNVNAKKNILEIASKLYKKTKLEHDQQQNNLVTNAEGKVAIPRLKKSINQCETLSNLHSNTLALNYSVSVSQQKSLELPTASSPPCGKANKDENVVTSTTKIEAQTSVPTLHMTNMAQNKFQELNVSVKSPRASPKLMKQSPDIKVSSTIPSPSLPKSKQQAPRPKTAPKPVINIKSALPKTVANLKKASKPRVQTQKLKIPSPRPITIAPKSPSVRNISPNIQNNLLGMAALISPNNTNPHSNKVANSAKTSKSPISPKQKLYQQQQQQLHHQKLDVNQLQEKYNLQNLAQLSASFNFPGVYGQQHNTFAAIQQAMLLNLGMQQHQNHQNWYNTNTSNMVQYEKFLQSLGAPTKTPPNGQNHLLSKEN